MKCSRIPFLKTNYDPKSHQRKVLTHSRHENRKYMWPRENNQTDPLYMGLFQVIF